ncbi:MAG: hypothetical protein ACYC99_14980 [Candidatus Geothermincolia bacterium]
MHYDLRFWEESLAPPDIAKKALPFLLEYKAGVAVALYPTSFTRRNVNAVRKMKEAGIEVTFWPLMEKEHGYFAGERNAPGYVALVKFLLDWAEKNDVMPDMIAVDLEMPIQQISKVMSASNPLSKLRGVYSSARENLDRERYYRAKARLEEMNSEIQDKGVRTLTAVLPWVGLEMETDYELLQDMSETPASGIGWDIVSPMLYVSMLEGMSGGAITRKDANWLVYDNCKHLRDKFGGRAGVSLGLTGGGVLEDEPVFGSPAQLLTGLNAALAAGVRDVSIYSLEGILSRDDPRQWFDAIRGAKPEVPERSRKVADSLTAARHVYPHVAKLVDWYRRPP